MEMLRALRLVIDTGIHYYGWDFKKSFDYMKKYSELMKLHVRIAAGERNPELLRQYNSLREYLELLKEDM